MSALFPHPSRAEAGSHKDEDAESDDASKELILIFPKGRIRNVGTSVQFNWFHQVGSQGYRVTLYKLVKERPSGKTLEIDLKTVDVPSNQTLTRDLDPGLSPGEYRWRVISWNQPGTSVRSQVSQDFTIEPFMYRPDTNGLLSVGYSSARLDYRGTQQTLSTLFSSGVAGPNVYFSYPFSSNFEADARYSEMQFVFRGEKTTYRTMELGGFFKTLSSRRMLDQRFAWYPGLRLRYGSTPEILSVDEIQITTGTMSYLSALPTVRFAFPMSGSVALVGSADIGYPLMIKSSTEPGGSTRGTNLSAHVEAGLRLAPIGPWVLGLDMQYMTEKLGAGTDADPIATSVSGVTFKLSVGFLFRNRFQDDRTAPAKQF